MTFQRPLGPQKIRTPDGDEMVVLSRSAHENLMRVVRQARAVLDEAAEDAGTERIVAESSRALAEGRDVEVPSDVAKAIMSGENAVRAVREWRGMTPAELARGARIGQGDLSEIERGASASLRSIRRIAKVLEVPTDLLVD